MQRQEYIELASGTTLTLTDTPVEGSVKYIYLLNADMTKNKTLTLTTDFTVSDKTVTLKETPATGTYLVIYDTDVAVAKRIINDGEKFSESVKLVINMLGEDPCTKEDFLVQTTIPVADLSGSFSLSVGDNPAVQKIEATAMLNVCSTNKELFSIVIA